MQEPLMFDNVGEDRVNPHHLRVTRVNGHYRLTLFRRGSDSRDYKPVSFGLTHEQVQAIAKLAEGS